MQTQEPKRLHSCHRPPSRFLTSTHPGVSVLRHERRPLHATQPTHRERHSPPAVSQRKYQTAFRRALADVCSEEVWAARRGRRVEPQLFRLFLSLSFHHNAITDSNRHGTERPRFCILSCPHGEPGLLVEPGRRVRHKRRLYTVVRVYRHRIFKRTR